MKYRSGMKTKLLIGASRTAILLTSMLAARAQVGMVVQEVPENFAMPPAPEQPIPYSHRLHLAFGLACEMCHASSGPDALMGFPATETCMTCHAAAATDRPAIQQLAEAATSGEIIAWQRVYQVLPGVIWAHEPHIEAGVQCGACHGDVSQQDEMAVITSVTAMASCISCHESHDAPAECVTCHAWPSE